MAAEPLDENSDGRVPGGPLPAAADDRADDRADDGAGAADVVAGAGAGADDDVARARARALSSPLRLRILRFCLYQERTNREIAAEFGLNPGTSLHHVRTLLETNFLVAGEQRRGRRGAREVPYRATGRSWDTPVPDVGPVLLRAFLDEVDGLPPADLDITRLGLKLSPAGERDLHARLAAVLTEFKERGPDPDGRLLGVMLAVHPERPRRSERPRPGPGAGPAPGGGPVSAG